MYSHTKEVYVYKCTACVPIPYQDEGTGLRSENIWTKVSDLLREALRPVAWAFSEDRNFIKINFQLAAQAQVAFGETTRKFF